MPAQLAFSDAGGGMNAADPPHKIAISQVARMTNCVIQDGLPTTRFGSRVVSLSGPDEEFVQRRNVQGSIFYNPAKGQGGIILAESNSSLATAIGGRKFLCSFSGRASMAVRDVTGGFATNGQLHLCWMSQWEDMLIAADGEGPTFIYHPTDGPSFSKGYNTKEKDKSQIPNGASVLAYIHARGVAVVNSRYVLVGDVLHRVSQTTSANLKDFIEQVYWATGPYFLPPSSMGGIMAAAILPLSDTAHGHGELILHCVDGIFSIDLSQYPRSKWSDLNLVKHVALQSGATGPYAVSVRDKDQLFRTRKGAQTLRSARASAGREGAPESQISPEVETWFSGDYGRWLRFSSVTVWDKMKRAVYSTAPVVQGRYRWHQGIVLRNLDPKVTEAQAAVWEGLWTLPPESRGITQLVGGIFDGEERQFAWTRGEDRRNRLVEFSPGLRHDMLSDGTSHPIRSQLITRAVDIGKWWEKRAYMEGTLFLRNIVGALAWGVWFRTEESPAWQPWRQGRVKNVVAGLLQEPIPRTLPVALGPLPDGCQSGASSKKNESRAIQFLVRWEGYCQIEGLRIEHGDKDLTEKAFDKTRLDYTFAAPEGAAYSDYEYSESLSSTWATQ